MEELYMTREVPKLLSDCDDLQSDYAEWGIKGTKKYTPGQPTTKTLPAGFYEVEEDSYGIHLELKSIQTDELYSLPSEELLDIVNDIINFWEKKAVYDQYKFVHKRGILMYGAPGNGKSGIIQLITKHLIEEMNGVVINIKDAYSLDRYSKIIHPFRSIEPNRPIIVILEDLDAMLSEDNWIVSTALNLLDGVKQVNNVVYIATTNYPEKLEERVANRPSRFDRRYEIALPNKLVRSEYIKHKLTKDDLEKINLEEWVEQTEGMSLSHLKELIISVIVLGKTFEESIERLNGLKKPVKIGKEIGL